MIPVSAVCLFCEDIRAEKSGQDTIVGTLPDNLLAQPASPPSPNVKPFLPRVGVYLRVHLDAERDIPKEISAKILSTDGQIVAQSKWERAVVEKSFADSKTNHMPLVGLIFKAVASPFPITIEGGKVTAVVIVDGVEYIAGALNVVVTEAGR
jgi:hypothetical protein